MQRHSSYESTDLATSSSPKPLRPHHRISHTKSRNGCYTCKGRRVKCDEQRPICGACSVRGSQCTFPSPGSTRNKPRRPVSHNTNGLVPGKCDHAAGRDGNEQAISPLSFNMGPVGTPTQQTETPSHLNMNDLNLLQHYIMHTSKKMSIDRAKSLVWERVFPDIASTNEFLMHLLLALAGLDILTRDSLGCQTQHDATRSSDLSTRNMKLAKLKVVIEHHQLGLKGLQEELWNTSESNAELLMTGSMLIVGFAFASLRVGNLNPEPQPSPTIPYSSPENADNNNAGKPHTHWLRLVRGVSSITQQHWMTLKRGRCRALLQFRNSHEDWKLCRSQLDGIVPDGIRSKISKFASGASQAVSNLQTFLDAFKSTEQFPTDSEESSILQEQHHALTVIEDMYMRVLYALQLQKVEPQSSSDLDAQAEIEAAAVTSWPMLVSQGFISSLESYEHIRVMEGLSFTILAHLYLTLSILENTWYLGATFDNEIVKINKLVAGLNDGQLKKLMEWPMEVIRSP